MNSQNALIELLLKKASQDKLAHFYILETSAPEPEAQDILLTFSHEFIRKYYRNIEGHKQTMANLMDHPDVYILGQTSSEKEKTDKSFKVDEAEALIRFFEFRPVQGKRKFALITEGHRVNSLIANKWLKLFEEPQGVTTIFLLNPRRTELLPTIHSRAIHLRIPGNKEQSLSHVREDFFKEASTLSLSEFLEKNAKGEEDLSFWANELIQWEALQKDGMHSKQELMAWLKSFREMEVYHQPTATKWTLFYSYLKRWVFPRIK